MIVSMGKVGDLVELFFCLFVFCLFGVGFFFFFFFFFCSGISIVRLGKVTRCSVMSFKRASGACE